MAGITGLGQTYNLPNYTGILYALTPADTPLFSAIGGLTSGGQSVSTEFEWETFDLRNAAQPAVIEGATAPTAQSRVRGNVTNVTQIHQEKVSVSYSKQAAVGQHAGTNTEALNPVRGEVDWQVEQMLKQMVRDVEYSFINGAYQKPVDNTTARKTRGLIPAIATNLTDNTTYTSAALSAATDTITETSTPRANGDRIIFSDVGASTTLIPGRVYYVQAKATNTFKVALSASGTPITIGTATVVYKVGWATTLTTDIVAALLQQVYDNGGIMEQGTAALLVNSTQKLALTKAYASAYNQYAPAGTKVGGVNVDTIFTDFGTLNVMLDRHVPADAIVVCSLEQCMPVFLEVPDKGHFFAEPLAKVGASDEVQLYGEVGLAYGNEKAHGVLRGLKL